MVETRPRNLEPWCVLKIVNSVESLEHEAQATGMVGDSPGRQAPALGELMCQNLFFFFLLHWVFVEIGRAHV